jgi:uncharacterized protein (AIM24 family)
MSKIALSPNAGGTGVFTIASPNSNSDRTLNLPDAGGTVFVSGQALSATTGSFSGNVTLGSSVLATPTGSAPSYTCRAWVNFNGTGTVAIRASGNVSSLTDLGTGSYQVNFTTAMPDANYSVATSAMGQSSATQFISNTYRTDSFATTNVKVFVTTADAEAIDSSIVTATVFR